MFGFIDTRFRPGPVEDAPLSVGYNLCRRTCTDVLMTGYHRQLGQSPTGILVQGLLYLEKKRIIMDIRSIIVENENSTAHSSRRYLLYRHENKKGKKARSR